MSPKRFALVGLFVENMHVMFHFYRDVLGIATQGNPNEPYVEFDHQGIRLGFYVREKLPELLGQTPAFPKGINGTLELALEFETREEVAAEFKRITAAGGQALVEPRDEPWGIHSAIITDPEGNIIELFCWLNKVDMYKDEPDVL